MASFFISENQIFGYFEIIFIPTKKHLKTIIRFFFKRSKLFLLKFIQINHKKTKNLHLKQR